MDLIDETGATISTEGKMNSILMMNQHHSSSSSSSSSNSLPQPIQPRQSNHNEPAHLASPRLHHPLSPKQNKNALFACDWLRENFELCDGAHIARELLFQEYCDYCMKHGKQPMNSASFGKIIRSVFPSIATRRLGTRGNSKYHYYGIKPRSEDLQCIIKAPPKSSAAKSKAAHAAAKVCGEHRPAPSDEFIHDLMRLPSPDYSKFPVGISMEHLTEFLRVYRVHCEELLREGLQGRFQMFGTMIGTFWRDIPEFLLDVLDCRETCRLIAEWDSTVFQAMLSVFLPDILSPGDKAMLRELRSFTKMLPGILASAFQNRPEMAFLEKSRVAHDFAKIVKQYYILNHLALAANNVMTQPDLLDKMTTVWQDFDFQHVLAQALYVCPNAVEVLKTVQETVLKKLAAKDNVTKWSEWVFEMIDTYMNFDTLNFSDYTYSAQQFVVRWHYIASLILRDICEKDKDIFASFHLIRLFCDEYVKYLVDCKLDERRRQLESYHAEQWTNAMTHTGMHPIGYEMFPQNYELPAEIPQMYAFNNGLAASQNELVTAHDQGAHASALNDAYAQSSHHFQADYYASEQHIPPMSSILAGNDAMVEEAAHFQHHQHDVKMMSAQPLPALETLPQISMQQPQPMHHPNDSN